jgi:hypothetical protein
MGAGFLVFHRVMITIVFVEHDTLIRLQFTRPEPCNFSTISSLVINRYYRKLIIAGSRTTITAGFGPCWCMSAVIGDHYFRR